MRGRATDPEKEAARREKIRASMREYAKIRVRDDDTGQWGKRPVEGTWGYTVISRERPKGTRRLGWDYYVLEDFEYGLETESDEDLKDILERAHPTRRYYRL